MINMLKLLPLQLTSRLGLGHRKNGLKEPAYRGLNRSVLHHNSQEGLEESYSDPRVVAAYLDLDRLLFYEYLINFFQERGVDYNDKTIADIGCATGHMLQSLRNRFKPKSLTGYEYSFSALEIARYVVPEAVIEFLDLNVAPPGPLFDIVFCSEVLEHFLHPDKGLRNVLAMCAHGGVIIITVPNGRIDKYEGHINFWSPESWEVFLNSQTEDKFEVEVYPVGSHLFTILHHKA